MSVSIIYFNNNLYIEYTTVFLDNTPSL
ncbi:hypothetical protein XBKB1_2170001 [Xenorhabdus bovienii str. kraussei Becker Underwood]|uniref:Uncharacterized protein n=1 Tax=Xenorhabdus bovienii str. kraussei Becker Underwood TaxID=1398204 RepID=A0A077PHQ9_XENBV|nr:hypothetical protein XBKB1_2170001 [Xenorhabdus bovienii str. kraussei Becker Underwood]